MTSAMRFWAHAGAASRHMHSMHNNAPIDAAAHGAWLAGCRPGLGITDLACIL
jgi:hypothetical protein